MNDPVLQEIKDRLNIADVISGYIPIKKAGANFKALCPFHHEKTPSLQISPQKQIWHCFGCGEGGDVFSFVMKYENLEFRDALKLLADKAGVTLPQYRPKDPQEESEKDLLFRINDFAARYYHQILIADKRGKAALQYLEQRGLSRKTIDAWQTGFAPDDFHNLELALAKKKIAANWLIKAGVSAQNEQGQVYDRFRGRITFPIFDYQGQCVGFSARILPSLDDGKSGKYINSPETAIYQKSKVLFGLNFAKTAIRKADEAIIVEGQMDTIAAHQAGIANVVASSGTALTLDQLMFLGRLTKNLKFCFDADLAGQAATEHAVGLYLSRDFTVKVVDLAGAKDPDELIKRSPENFLAQVKDAPLFLDYFIAKLFAKHRGDSVESKKLISKSILPYVKQLTDPLEQDHYIKLLANKFDVGEKALWDAISKISLPKSPSVLAQKPALVLGKPAAVLEKEVLGGLLTHPEFLKEAAASIQADDFEDFEIKKIVQELLEAKGADSPTVSQATVAKEARFMVESQLDEFGGNLIAFRRELFKALALLKISAIKKAQGLLQSEIKRAELSNNQTKLQELRQKFAQISAQRAGFETYL